MEYIKDDDLEAIGSIIEEFEGDTILGKHMFKAVKAYFKQKNKQCEVIYTPETIKAKTLNTADSVYKTQLDNMIKEADIALHKHYLKLRKKGESNGIAKSKKKANS